MLKQREPISAFAMYAMKRKNVELSSKSKKFKRRHASPGKKTIPKNNIKLEVQEKTRQTAAQRTVQHTNKVPTNKIQNISKKNVVSKKPNHSATSKKNKAVQKVIHNRQNNNVPVTASLKEKVSKKKVKGSLLTINTGVAKMKQITQKQYKSRKFMKKDDQQKAYTRSKVAEENHENPLKTSHSMFEWLIHPMKVEDFFE